MQDLENLKSSQIISMIRMYRYSAGSNYSYAKEKAQPYLDELNRRGTIIAKRHKKKFHKMHFAGWGTYIPKGSEQI